MTKVVKEEINNENIEFNRKHNNKKSDMRNGSQIANWSEQLVMFALSHLNFSEKKQEKKVLRQQRSYEKMKLNYENAIHLNKSISAESIMFLNTQIATNDQFLRPEKSSKNGSYETISDDSQSDISSQISASGSLTSVDSSTLSSQSTSSNGYGSLFDLTAKKRDDIRIVPRFGNDFRDPCIFPLALPIHDCDLSKGKLTWDKILLKADLVLKTWEEKSINLRKVNRVFGSPSDFICPDSSLQNQFLLYPRAQKPLKKWNSFEDLQQLSHEKQSFQNKSNAKLSASTDETLFAKQEFKRLEINSNNKSQSDLTINKLNKTTDDSYELKCFKSYSSLESAEDSSEKFNINAKALMRSIKVKSPVTLALQISKIDRECFLRLKRDQIFYCMIGGQDSNEYYDLTELNVLLEFGRELNQFVSSIIRKEITPETQGKKIAGLIEVACILRKLRNWHSLCIIIRALQSPKIYFMEEAWMAMKRSYPIHYNDYLKLCRLVRQCETCIMGSTRSSIPSIFSLVSSLRIHCIATWDLLDNKRRWTEQPSIAGWLDNELIGQLVESQKMREKQEEDCILSLDANQCSLLPVKDTNIRFIHYSSLPNNWTKKDIKFIPNSYLKQTIICFKSSLDNEMSLIDKYFIPSYQS